MKAKSLAETERRHWLEIVDQALAANPGVNSLLYDRAVALRDLGAYAEAEVAYRNLLTSDPGNFDGMIELSSIFMHQARYVEAFQMRVELLKQYPQDATAIAYMADMILLSGDVDAAYACYEQALALAPHHVVVHQGLAAVARARGQSDLAAEHDDAASCNQTFFPRQYRGEGDGIPLVLFVSEAEESTSSFADRMLDEATFLVTKCIVERMTSDTQLPPHAVMVNGIGDADRAQAALVQLQEIAARSKAPLINDPAAIAETGRAAMSRRLAKIPGVRVPNMLELTPDEARSESVLATLATHGFTFPLLIRVPNYHAGRFFEKIDIPEQFAGVVAGFPSLPMLAMEYIDTRGSDAYFHKGRIMVIDGNVYPTHMTYGPDWKLHYFSSKMMHEPDLREEEARFLADPESVLGERAWHAVQSIAKSTKLEYFGIDFALTPNGDLVVFECNAAMVIAKPGPESLWAYRRPSYEAAMRAADRMIKRRAKPSDATMDVQTYEAVVKPSGKRASNAATFSRHS